MNSNNNFTSSSTLDSLNRAVEISKRKNLSTIELIGSTTPSSLAWLLTNERKPIQPRLVICPNEKVLKNLLHDLHAFDQSVRTCSLSAFDENPYSGLYPSRTSQISRTHFLWRALHSSPQDIFVATIEGLLQQTMPITLFKDFEISLHKDEEVDLQTLLNQLVI